MRAWRPGLPETVYTRGNNQGNRREQKLAKHPRRNRQQQRQLARAFVTRLPYSHPLNTTSFQVVAFTEKNIMTELGSSMLSKSFTSGQDAITFKNK